jgi:hypothetical protein
MASGDDDEQKDYGHCSHEPCAIRLTPCRTVRCPECGSAICTNCALLVKCPYATNEDPPEDDE